MKTLLGVLAAGLAVTLLAEKASAQGPPPGVPQPVPSYVQPPEAQSGIQSQYGLHPGLKRLVPTRRGCDGCDGGGIGHGAILAKLGMPFQRLWGKMTAETPPPPPVNGGTLAFPNHTFVRSPRDFFMLDQ